MKCLQRAHGFKKNDPRTKALAAKGRQVNGQIRAQWRDFRARLLNRPSACETASVKWTRSIVAVGRAVEMRGWL